MIINATVRDPINDVDICIKWLNELVSAISMEILIPPSVKYCDIPGNEGLTGTVVITTSHISIHIWSEVPNPYIRMDVYSCKDFDPKIVMSHIDDRMGIIESDEMIIDRNSTKLNVVNS
jgi:S-adenosylmethionine/arginine decarboxylase-like enzyme